MKRLMFVSLLSCVLSVNAYADDFNYESPDQCGLNLEVYSDKALDLAYEKPQDLERMKGFTSMYSVLYKLSAKDAVGGESCDGSNCFSFRMANCSLATIKPLWDQVKPLLNKQINQYLNNAVYDPNLKPNTYYQVRCYYPKDKPSMNNCKLIEMLPHAKK